MTRLTTTSAHPLPTAVDQFQQLWHQIDKQKARLAAQDARISKVVSRFNKEILPLEQELARSQHALAKRLLTFFSRKTLAQWQRDELLEWLQQEFSSLSSNPYANSHMDFSDSLVEFEALIKHHYPEPEPEALSDEQRQQLKQHLQEELGLELSDDNIDLFMHSPAHFLRQMKQKPQDEENEGEQTAEHNEDTSNHRGSSDDSQASVKALIGRLYKQLAKKLHPDKEPEPGLKAIRQKQMQQLQAARQENDMHTLLELHQEHLGSQTLPLQDIGQITTLLQQQLKQLEQQYEAAFMSYTPETLIWNQFRHMNRLSGDTLFRERANELQSGISHYSGLLKRLKTLADVRKFQLQQRLEDW